MKSRALPLCLVLSLAVLAALHAQRGPAAPAAAIVGAKLIDGTGSAPIANGESGYYYVEHPEFLDTGLKLDGFYARGRAAGKAADIHDLDKINRVMRAGKWVD